MDLLYLFRVLLKRKWLILTAAVLASATAYYFTRNQPKKYRSKSQISTGFTVTDEIKVNNDNFNFYEADTKFSNAIYTCSSPSVVQLVSYSLILHDLKSTRPFKVLTSEEQQSPVYRSLKKEDCIRTFSNKLEAMSMLTSFNPEEKKLQEYLNLYGYGIKSLSDNLNVYRLERTDYIQIDFISENPELSAFVVNEIYQQFLRYYKNVRSDKSQESIDTLRSLMEKKKQELDAKNDQLLKQGGFVVGDESSSTFGLISSLEQTLNEETSNQITLRANLEKVKNKLAALGGGSVPVRTNTDNDELLILRKERDDAYKDWLNSGSSDNALLSKYNTLKTQYQQKYLSANPAGSRQNDAVSKQRNDLMDEKNGIEIDIDASNTRIASIQRKINQQKGLASSSASKGTVVESLQKEADLANKEYLAAKQKYTDAMDISTSSVNNFRQVLLGQPAYEPEPTKRKLIIGMAGMAAMLTTMLVIILLAYLDSSVKTPFIFNKTVNLKLIGMINFTDLTSESIEDILSNKVHETGKDRNKFNAFRESIRKLRFEIENTGKKIFLFTSTKKGMGKTTIIQAISYSMSLSKKKILVIDTNFCNNDLTVRMNADPVLEKITAPKSEDFLEQVRKYSKEVGKGSVFVIGSEGGDYTPSEILPQENILKHLHELTTEFDYIFLEGPPLNDFSDSKELSRYVDGVIAVFSATQIIKQIDKESMRFYKESDEKFCGAILNMVNLDNVNVI